MNSKDAELAFYFGRALDSNLENNNIQTVKSSINNSTNSEYTYPYIDEEHIREKCMLYNDYDKDTLIILALVPVIYLILAVCLICFCCKLRRVNNQYQQLVDDETGTNTGVNSNSERRSRNVENQLEMTRASKKNNQV